MGHVIPCVRLAKALEANGHTVHFLVCAYAKEKAEKHFANEDNTIIPHYLGRYSRAQFFKGWEHRASDLGNANLHVDSEVINDFYKVLAEIKPDIVVNDFYSTFGMAAADKLGIPVVINSPGPLEFMQYFFDSKAVNPKRTRACCGCLCVCPETFPFLMTEVTAIFLGQDRMIHKRWHSGRSRIVICNSFIGLDLPQLIPPNIYMTGPLLNAAHSDPLAKLQEKDEDLFNWLEDAAAKN